MTRRRHSSEFKAGIALEAVRGDVTVAEIAKKYGVHPGQVQAWKAEALANFATLFEKGGSLKEDSESHVAALERKVGQLAVENDFLKKSWAGYLKRSGGK